MKYKKYSLAFEENNYNWIKNWWDDTEPMISVTLSKKYDKVIYIKD